MKALFALLMLTLGVLPCFAQETDCSALENQAQIAEYRLNLMDAQKAVIKALVIPTLRERLENRNELQKIMDSLTVEGRALVQRLETELNQSDDQVWSLSLKTLDAAAESLKLGVEALNCKIDQQVHELKESNEVLEQLIHPNELSSDIRAVREAAQD